MNATKSQKTRRGKPQWKGTKMCNRHVTASQLFQRQVYRFKSGRFAGKPMEQVLLQKPAELYCLVEWAERESILPRMQSHFERLRKKLEHVPSVAKCQGPDCKRGARWLTLPYSYPLGWLPQPYYWCDSHGPGETEGISQKFRIHFDVIPVVKDKWGQKEISKCVRQALGIKKGTRITETFAKRFFANLRNT